jgi:hypothetical protein
MPPAEDLQSIVSERDAMEPTGIEPVTRCLQKRRALQLVNARRREVRPCFPPTSSKPEGHLWRDFAYEANRRSAYPVGAASCSASARASSMPG